MATSSTELILRFTGDPRQLKQTLAAVRADLSQFSRTQTTTAQAVGRQTQQVEQRRISDTIRSANQRLREEQRAAREVVRITAETARQAAAQERIRERAAKQLTDVRIREAKRAAKELERSLAAGRAGATGPDVAGTISNVASRIPGIGPNISGLTAGLASLTTSATAAGGALAIAAGAVAAVTVAAGAGVAIVIALGQALFDAAKEAAEFAGKFEDLSQQVGVSVETLSTLDIVASTTGGNIETVTASLAIFQKNLEEAHDPTSKEAKLLKELGVTSLGTEAALRQTIAGLFRLGEGTKQTDSALQLFGRSGRFINAILKESQGDLDAATAKFQKMGLVVSTEAALAADRFNDSLEILHRQLATITRSLAADTIPVFITFFEQVSLGLTGNAESWKSWGRVLEAEIAGVIALFQTFVQFVASRGTISFGAALESNIDSILAEIAKVRGRLELEAVRKRVLALHAAALAGRPGDRPDPAKAQSEAEQRAAKSIALSQRALEESTRVHREQLERERRLDLSNIDEWEQGSIQAIEDHRILQEKIFNEELANVRLFVKDRADALLAEREIQQRRTKLTNDTVIAIQKIEEEAQRKRDQSELNLNRQLNTIREADRAAETERIRAELERQSITESTAIQRSIALLTQAHQDRLVLINLELAQTSTSAEKKVELDNEKLASEIHYTTEFKKLTQERIDALVREGAAQTPKPNEDRRIPENQPLPPIDIGLPPPDGVSVWEEAMRRLRLQMQGFNDFVKQSFLGSFGDIADALAQGVVAWALYGESFGKAMKQALAAVAAKISAEATFQAVLHAAYAIGSLAFGDFRGAAQHGIAAAKFAAVAAVAAIGARALAGGAAARAGAGGGGGNAFSEPPRSNTDSRSRERDPIDLVRQQQKQEIHIFVHGEPGPRYKDSILSAVVDSVQSNGTMRTVIKQVAGG